jgi:hypothetical protein
MGKRHADKQREQTKFAFQQLLENREVQAHLRTGAIRVHEAWSRATGRPFSYAVEDKKLYDKIREAATSLARAAKLLAPEPEPPKHRGRKLAVIAVAGGGAVLLKKRRASKRALAAEPVPVAPMPAPPPGPTTGVMADRDRDAAQTASHGERAQ